MPRLVIELSKAQHARVRKLARDAGTTVSDLVRRALGVNPVCKDKK